MSKSPSRVTRRPTPLVGLVDDALVALTQLRATYPTLAADCASTGLALGPLITTSPQHATVHVRHVNARSHAFNVTSVALREAKTAATCACRHDDLVALEQELAARWSDCLLRMSDRRAEIEQRMRDLQELCDVLQSTTLFMLDLQFHYETSDPS